jgi:hypothetical protein
MYHANKDRKVLCTIDFILIHRYCIENLSKWKTFWTASAIML